MFDRFRDIGLNVIRSEGGPTDVEVFGKKGMLHAKKEAQRGGNAVEKSESLSRINRIKNPVIVYA